MIASEGERRGWEGVYQAQFPLEERGGHNLIGYSKQGKKKEEKRSNLSNRREERGKGQALLSRQKKESIASPPEQ